MKKKHIFLLITFLLTTFFSYSQFYFGNTKEEVKTILKRDNPDAHILLDSSNLLQFYLPNSDTYFKIYFKEDTSYMGVLIPNNELALNKWIEGFNKSYIVKSEKEWNYYTTGYLIKFKLVFLNNINIIVASQTPINKIE